MLLQICCHIYICCRAENLSKNCTFLSWKSVQMFLFMFQKYSPFCKENAILIKKKKENKKQKNTFCWAENLSNYVAQHNWTDFQLNLGQIFSSTILLIFFLFSFLKRCSNPNFYSAFSKNNLFVAHPPKIRNTICEHDCANWFLSFSAYFGFWGYCCVRFCWIFFWKEWKTKNTKQPSMKQDHKMQTRKALSLVYKKRKQTTQPQNNATSLFRLQTDNTRNNKNNNKNIKHKNPTTF